MPEWGLVCSFWIDTDGYTPRDRDMFVCGVEFQMLYDKLGRNEIVDCPIHTENESRLRMLCGTLKLPCSITATGTEGWSRLQVPPPPEPTESEAGK